MKQLLPRLLGVLLLAGLASCALWRAPKVPMDVLKLPARCPTSGPIDTLVVFLPGAYSRPEEFVREGIVRTLRERHIAADALQKGVRLRRAVAADDVNGAR